MAGNIWTKYEDMKKETIENGTYVELIDDIIDNLKELEELDDYFICSNCGEKCSIEEIGSSEVCLQDKVCIYCQEQGYGME